MTFALLHLANLLLTGAVWLLALLVVGSLSCAIGWAMGSLLEWLA